MRLTLRTLLAYLDDLLDRSDAEELRQKIQCSPLASPVSASNPAVRSARFDSTRLELTAQAWVPTQIRFRSIWTIRCRPSECLTSNEFVLTRMCIWAKSLDVIRF